jgi:hypothetical protein
VASKRSGGIEDGAKFTGNCRSTTSRDGKVQMAQSGQTLSAIP